MQAKGFIIRIMILKKERLYFNLRYYILSPVSKRSHPFVNNGVTPILSWYNMNFSIMAISVKQINKLNFRHINKVAPLGPT